MRVCNWCKQYRRVKRTIANGSHQQKNKLIMEMAELYWNTDADLNDENAIADGSWPQAVEILERRLKRAREKADEIRTRKSSNAVRSGDGHQDGQVVAESELIS